MLLDQAFNFFRSRDFMLYRRPGVTLNHDTSQGMFISAGKFRYQLRHSAYQIRNLVRGRQIASSEAEAEKRIIQKYQSVKVYQSGSACAGQRDVLAAPVADIAVVRSATPAVNG